MKYAYIPDRVA